MKYPDFKYIAITTYRTNRKRTVVDISLIKPPYKLPECYRSWCRFSDDIISYQNIHNKSLRGYDGLCYSDFLPIDIDNDTDPRKSLITCRELIEFLHQEYLVPIKSIRIYFSGSKGFHIEIPTILFGDIKPSRNLPLRFKSITKSFGFSDIDTKIYFKNGLWRLYNSVNGKSGLYKIPLSYSNLNNYSYNQIIELAKIPNNAVVWTSFNDWTEIEGLKQLWKQSKPIEQHRQPTNNPSNLTNKTIIYYPGAPKGKRNDMTFKIAHQLRRNGYTINEVKDYIVNVWNPTCKPPEEDIISLLRAVESAYSYNNYDNGSIGITKHFRTDPYYFKMDCKQKAIYVHLLSRLNEIEKDVFGKFICKPNQCIFSYGKVARHLRIDKQRVKTLIKYLVKCGRVKVDTLYENKRASCSKITFLCIDLTQYLTQQNDLSRNTEYLTQPLTTTNINNKGFSNK